MNRLLIPVAALAAMTGSADAAGPVIFMGGFHVFSTTGCTGSDPVRAYKLATMMIPVTGSTNGSDSTLALMMGRASTSFQLRNARFPSTFRTVEASGTDGRTWTFTAQIKITSMTPATITTSTQTAEFVGALKGGLGSANCVASFRMNGVKL